MMFGLRGYYKLRVREWRRFSGWRHVFTTDWFPNVITNAGLDMLGTGANWAQFAVIGSGTATPSFTDSQLQALAASTAGQAPGQVQTFGVAPNYISAITYARRMSLGALNGNYSEVGLGSSPTTLFSRALILDNLGNPTSITVTAAQQLDVFYTVTQQPNLADVTGTVSGPGVSSVGYTGRPSAVSSNIWLPVAGVPMGSPFSNSFVWGSGAILGAITGQPSGGDSALVFGPTRQPYVLGSYRVDTVMSLALDAGNVAGGIQAVLFNQQPGGAYQYRFDSPILKNASSVATFTHRTSWARA